MPNSLQFSNSIPNSTAHFAIGDITRWTGIKRAGNALYMGQFAATNLVRLMSDPIGDQSVTDLSSTELDQFPPLPQMMALAVGRSAVAYGHGQAVQHGRAVLEGAFGKDLGLSSKLFLCFYK
jgi:hypothetical protein